MKKLLVFLLTIFAFVIGTIGNFMEMLWYGKLPKVSLFHQLYGTYKTSEKYNDENAQVKYSNQVPRDIQRQIIFDYLDELYKNEAFKNNVSGIDVPIFDGKEIIGTQGVYPIMHLAVTTYLDKYNVK